MYRAVVIGAGRIGTGFDECHAKAYKDCVNTELVGIVDTKLSKAQEAGEKWGVDCAFVQADIYSICTPPETHVEVVADLIPHKPKAIYLEKPIATTLEDADTIISFCGMHGIILQVNHQRRWGIPTLYYSRGILNTMTHGFDMLRMMFGEPWLHSNNYIHFKNITVKIQEVITDDPVFEFKIDTKDAILKGVDHLVECIKYGKQSISSGHEAREDLRLCIEMMNDRV